jgi:hypothetical protein
MGEQGMKNRIPALGAALLLGIIAGLLGLSASAPGSAASASAVKKPKPSPSPSPSPSGTFVKAYAAIVNGSPLDLTPLDVQATSDGGSVALSETETSAGLGVDWLVKLSAAGVPQWQEQVGCASPQGAPGDYADGVSVQQTADGGYVVAGQTIDCGSGSSCPPLSGRSCALVEKLDSAGRFTWARVYPAGFAGSALDQIRQTADGGYIAAGSFTDSSQDTGALLLKLDSAGNVQWQKDLGPAGSTTQAYFNTVQQTSGGGYVAAGAYYTPASGPAPTQVLVARFGADGSLAWQHGFATLGGGGAPTSVADASSIIQTPDGGYAVAGRWFDQAVNGGNGAQGALLVKLDASGTLQWQQAYSGGCYVNSYGTCTNIGAVSYSLHQASDGGYVLAGDGDLELAGSGYLVPWLAKTDASGALLWQHFYYQASPEYGTPLSENFQASALAPGGGFLATGPTLNSSTQKHELYAVRTDSSGLAGTCTDVHPATPLQAINPGLAAVAPSLPLGTAITQAASSPITTLPTSITTHQDC